MRPAKGVRRRDLSPFQPRPIRLHFILRLRLQSGPDSLRAIESRAAASLITLRRLGYHQGYHTMSCARLFHTMPGRMLPRDILFRFQNPITCIWFRYLARIGIGIHDECICGMERKIYTYLKKMFGPILPEHHATLSSRQ